MLEGDLENTKISAAVELDIAPGPAVMEQPALQHSVPSKDSLKPQTTLRCSSCCPDRGVVLPSKPVGADRCSPAVGNQLDTQRKHRYGFCSSYFTGNRRPQS